MTEKAQAQLFTQAGERVADVDVEMTPDGKWPLIVTHQGRTFALQNGRYVHVMTMTEATARVP